MKVDEHASKKRPSARVRQRWSDEETAELMRGVAVHGVGKWKQILEHPDYNFLPGRTGVDLKDR